MDKSKNRKFLFPLLFANFIEQIAIFCNFLSTKKLKTFAIFSNSSEHFDKILCQIKEREAKAERKHLQETVDELRKFNAKRRLKDSILASLLSAKWNHEEKETNDEDNLTSNGTRIIQIHANKNINSIYY
jgi:hypothetical protein